MGQRPTVTTRTAAGTVPDVTGAIGGGVVATAVGRVEEAAAAEEPAGAWTGSGTRTATAPFGEG